MICDNCKNKDVCKYKTSVESFENDITNVSNETKLIIEIQCKERRV